MAAETNGYISRGNMTVIISAAGLVMIAFGGFVTFQNNATDRRITDLQADIKAHLRKDEHEEFKLRIDKDLTRLDIRITAAATRVVPRSEHEARWAATDKDVRLLAERLNELRNTSTSTYTVRDEINRLQTEIQDLRKVLSK